MFSFSTQYVKNYLVCFAAATEQDVRAREIEDTTSTSTLSARDVTQNVTRSTHTSTPYDKNKCKYKYKYKYVGACTRAAGGSDFDQVLSRVRDNSS